MKINPKLLTFAREYRGYSQTDLSSNIKGLSQSNLSKFEKGLGTLSDDVLKRVIAFLNFPESFFEHTISNNVEHAHYRKKAGLSKREKEQIERSNKLIGYIIDQMADSIDFPQFALNVLDIEGGYTPESAAHYTRKHMGFREGAVKEICAALERFGIIVVEQIYNTDCFDGVSFFTDKGFPVIIINREYSNDRKRFTLAHELGHIVMHLPEGIAIPDYRNVEKEANLFAAEFLMPEAEIKNALYGLKMSQLMPLKQYWLTSMAAIVRRANDLKCIDEKRYKLLNTELSRRGYKKKEPGNVFIDDPANFESAYSLFVSELGYSDMELAKAFDLPLDVVVRFCNQCSGLRVVPLMGS